MSEETHVRLREFYAALIRLRKEIPALSCHESRGIDVTFDEAARTLLLKRRYNESEILAVFNFSKSDKTVEIPAGGYFVKIMESSDILWKGPGTILPDGFEGSQKLSVKRESFGLFLAQSGGGDAS